MRHVSLDMNVWNMSIQLYYWGMNIKRGLKSFYLLKNEYPIDGYELI